ncbi:hypothetical protein SLEP1_g35701 [Rubroshorea leprosula]|uniref:Uncharacterized protein n=1 Tax=Rubroshorea leprosula TaxID=152421 RepID=A0AAV5KPB1_9ROSI|nr:hypothetical protein SLEP1_g35701 [Rubroshorea leprosula]
MAAFSFGTQFSPLHRLKHRPHLSSSPKPLPSLRYLPSFGSPFCRIRVPRLVGDAVLARAEDKAKASPPPPFQEEAESNNEKQLEVLYL